MKRRIRLTESDLHRIVKGSVNSVLNESIINMTREEEIRNAAIDACFAEWHNGNSAIVDAFIAGAEWADTHPTH